MVTSNVGSANAKGTAKKTPAKTVAKAPAKIDTRQWQYEPAPGGIGPPTPIATRGSSGIIIGRPQPAGSPLNYHQPVYSGLLAGMAQPAQTPGENTNPTGIGGGRGGGGGGRGGGGGGGGGGPNPDQIRALAGDLYNFNAAPYDLMHQQVTNQRTQAQGYNPDFAGMQNTYNQGLANIDQMRAASVAARLNDLVGFGRQLGQQATGQMQGALRDLSAQGVAPGQYMDQATAQVGDRTSMLANQGQYMGQLNASAANQMAQDQSLGGLIRQGGEANLANNRGTLMNQLSQQDAQIGLQQAQAQQQNDQARREFMLKYGVI